MYDWLVISLMIFNNFWLQSACFLLIPAEFNSYRPLFFQQFNNLLSNSGKRCVIGCLVYASFQQFDSRKLCLELLLQPNVAWLQTLCKLLSCVSLQAEYEVTQDEKRKECGQELIDKYLNPKVAAVIFFYILSNKVSLRCFPELRMI